LIVAAVIGRQYAIGVDQFSGGWGLEWDDFKYGLFAGAIFLLYPVGIKTRAVLFTLAAAAVNFYAANVGWHGYHGGGIVHLAIILISHTFILLFVYHYKQRRVWLFLLALLGAIGSIAICAEHNNAYAELQRQWEQQEG
jgi:hypothetical protein